jgi:hypothetical protein
MRFETGCGPCGVSVLALALFAGPASADFKTLAARVPGDANVVALIDVQAVLNSPLAVEEGWKARMASAYGAKPITIPPDTSRIVIAALLDPVDMEPIWQVSVADLANPPSLDLMARAQKGYVDKLGQAPAVWSPFNAYFIQLDPLVLGSTCPADRQWAARWAARQPGLPGNSISAYLANAVGAVSARTPIVMAIDLQDVTCATKVRGRLATEKFESLETRDVNLDALSKVIGSVKGMTLSVAIGKEITCKGAFDFGQDTGILAGYSKPLLLDVLSKMGAYLEDLETWKVLAKGRQVSFEGQLSTGGLRHLLSIVEPPAPGGNESAGTGTADAGGKDPKATASLEYYHAVKEIIQNLDKQVQGGRAATLPKIATWMKRDATAISRLPILGIDPDLVNFAADVSVRLNDAARVMSEGSLESQARTTGIRSTHVRTSYAHNYDYYGAYDGSARRNDNAQARAAAAQAEAQRKQAALEDQAKAVAQAGEIFKGIKAEAQKLRIEMTNRYQVEF